MTCVAVAPEEIRPGTPCPADFDEFWAKAIERYDAEVKGEVTLTLLPEKVPGGELEHFEVKVPTFGGKHIQGMMSRPKDLSKGPFPLRLGAPIEIRCHIFFTLTPTPPWLWIRQR